MTREKELEILMKDRYTKKEAEAQLKRGCTIFDDFEEGFDFYMDEWGIDEEDRENYKDMISKKVPLTDWGIVEDNGKTYYIMYAN